MPPIFLCFLGQRRGWVPDREMVSASTLAALPGLSELLGKSSVTELEIMHAVLRPLAGGGVYNAREVEAAHPCRQAFFYLRDPSYLPQLPPELLTVYTSEAIEDTELAERDTNAVRQWRENIIPNSGKPVHTYQASYDANASTPELAIPPNPPSESPEGIKRWKENWRRAGLQLAPNTSFIDAGSETGHLSSELNRRRTAGRLSEFRCGGDHALGSVVLDDLKRAIKQEFPENRPLEGGSEIERELDQQEYFLAIQAEGFVERSGDFDAIDTYVEGKGNRLLMVSGPAGVGKTTLLANWIERYRRRCKSTGEAMVQFRFIGAGDRSTDTAALLQSLLQEWHQSGRLPECPTERAEIYLALSRYLEAAAQTGKIVIVLDGLDQLDQGTTDLSWIPQRIPAGARIIVSIREDKADAKTATISNALKAHLPVLTQIKPLHDEADRRRLIESFTSQYLKQLDGRHIETLLRSTGATNPLFLKVVLSELRVFGSFSGLAQKIDQDFGSSPHAAFSGMLRRLEADAAYSELDPRHFVPLLLGLLSHARQGLSMAELLDVLSECYPWDTHAAVPEPVQRRRWVEDSISLYLRQMRSFLEVRSNRIDFFYSAFRQAAADRYTDRDTCTNSRPAVEWHAILAGYFEMQAAGAEAPAGVELSELKLLNTNLESRVTAMLSGGIFGLFTSGQSQMQTVQEAIVRVQAEFTKATIAILGIDELEAAAMFQTVLTQGSHIAGRMPTQLAIERKQRLERLHVIAEVNPIQYRFGKPWTGSKPRYFQEFLYHAIRGRQWQQGVEAFCDPIFHQSCITLAGHLVFLIQFKEFVRSLSSDSNVHVWLQRLCDDIPITPTTRPLLEDLAEGMGSDLSQLCQLLSSSLAPEKNQERAIVPFKAFLSLAEKEDKLLNASERASLQSVMSALLRSTNTKIAWRACEAFWQILPDGDTAELLHVAIDEQRHVLVRSEAARQLGESDDLLLVEPLQRLAASGIFPLTEMAQRSASRILVSHDRIDPGSIDDWSQPTRIPTDLYPLFREVEQLGVTVDLRRFSGKTPLIVAINEPSGDTFDLRWKTVQLILLILRRLPCTSICTEGADREVTLTPAKNLTSGEIWRHVAMRYLWEGLICPAEYINLATEYPIRLLGVEYGDLYNRASAEKYRGGVGVAAVGSIERATSMIDNCIRWIERHQSDVVILLTKVVPGFMVGRLMGLETAEADGMMESMLPEKVTMVHPRANDFSFVRVNMMKLDDKRDDEFSYDPHLHHLLLNQYAARDIAGLRVADEKPISFNSDASAALPKPDNKELDALGRRVLRGMVFVKTDLKEIDFSVSDGWHASFRGSDLEGVCLERARLHGAKFTDALLCGTDFRNANLFEARLDNADLDRANLTAANLVGATLTKAKLREARLTEASLFGANLHEADLTACDLTLADLREAFIGSAILRQSDLTGARMDGTKFDCNTAWPGPVPLSPELILVDPPISDDLRNDLKSKIGFELANIAVVNLRHGFVDPGLKQIDEVVALWRSELGSESPDAAACINALTRGLQLMDLHSHALPLARLALRIWRDGDMKNHPSMITGLNNLGLSLFETGDLDRAEQILTEAINLDHSFPNPYYWLAQVYQRKQLPQQEAMAWEKYLDGGPSDIKRQEEAISRLVALRE